MDGNQDAALSYTAVIALGFVFRDTHTDQGSNESADSATRTYAGECCHDRSRGNKWAEARNRQRPYANQKAKRTADGATRTCPRSDALRSLGVLLVCGVFRPIVAGEQYGNVLMPKSGCEKGDNSLLDLNLIGIDAECCRVLSCHMPCLLHFLEHDSGQRHLPLIDEGMGRGLTGNDASERSTRLESELQSGCVG